MFERSVGRVGEGGSRWGEGSVVSTISPYSKEVYKSQDDKKWIIVMALPTFS